MNSGRKPLQLILQTKLYSPHLNAKLVNRERLLAWMNRSQELPLTLVSAPAGYGKSILASQWAAQSSSPVAWLSLDNSDSDLRIFLEYFVAAVTTVAPGSCKATQSLLTSQGLPPLALISANLLNDLQSLDTAIALVLDDYHRIESTSPVHELFRLLLEHPPEQVRFVLLSRRDPPLPLGKLRASGQMLEVRLQDLRFTRSETAVLLTAMSEVIFSDDAITRLQDEIEGWAVGLRLVTLAMRNVADPEVFLKGLHGGLPTARSYLMQEVLGSLAPGMREYLLATSILDRFCAPLVEAIAEVVTLSSPTQLTADEFIEQLQASNLFTLSLDTRGEWFRYHHLFQELLQEELGRTETSTSLAALHMQASQWFEASSLVDEALHHALEGGHIEHAAQIIIRHRQEALNADQWYVLEKWLSRLPGSTLQQHAGLLLTQVWIFIHQSRWDAAALAMERAAPLIGDDPEQDALLGELELFQGYMLFFLGHGAESLQHIEQALARIPRTFYEARAQCEVIFALSSQMVGRTESAMSDLNELLEQYDSPDNVRKTRLLITYVFVHFLSGDLKAAERANNRLRMVAEADEYAYAVAWADYMQGQIHLYRYELEEAESCLKRSVGQRFTHHKRAAADSMAALVLAQQARGEALEAGETLDTLRDYVAGLDDPAFWALLDSSSTRLSVLQGHMESTSQVISDPSPVEEAMLWWIELPLLTYCRALLAAGTEQQAREAQALLEELIETAEGHHNTCQLIGILCLQSLAFEQQGETRQALNSLERALELATPGGFAFPFVEPGPAIARLLRRLRPASRYGEFIDHLLSVSTTSRVGAGKALSPAASDTRLALLEDLTNRELDILVLLAQRMQNKEIANQLFISTHTVKDHLKRIYQKLGVSNRRQAVSKALEIGIITPGN